MPKSHNPEVDRVCKVCKWTIQAFIPHECDPSICKTCYGKGELWLGRDHDTKKWMGFGTCRDCEGTGKTRYGM